jgi:hypothetical protein
MASDSNKFIAEISHYHLSGDVMKNQKKPAKHGRKLWPYFLLAAASLFFLGWFTVGRQSEPKDVPAFMRYLGNHKDPRVRGAQAAFTPSFSLNRSPNGTGTINAEAQAWIANRWNQIRIRLESYPQENLRNLAVIFEQSLPAAFLELTKTNFGYDLVHVRNRPVAESDPRTGLKIIFYGPWQYQGELKRILGSPLGYDPQLETIFVPDYEGFDPVLVDAQMFHELAHVKQSRTNRAFGGEDKQVRENGKLTDAGADDEIEAHEVGYQIFEIGTRGEYGRRISTVVASKAGAKNPIEALLKFTPEELDWVDEALGKPAAEENGYRRGQYFFDLGREWIDVHLPESQRKKALREYFKAINE